MVFVMNEEGISTHILTRRMTKKPESVTETEEFQLTSSQGG